MRLRAALPFALLAATGAAHAQSKAKAPAGPEMRYFTAIEGLMEGNADVVLKELRQGKNVQSATLDVCYPAEANSERKDRFIATLTPSGGVLSGTATSQIDKQPISVKLTQKPNGDNFEFKGTLTIGASTVDISSAENSDLSEKEFQETQASDDGITQRPKDFTDVSAEAVAVKVKNESVVEFLKSLRGTPVEISPTSLTASCEALRSGATTLFLTTDPMRSAELVAQARGVSGVIAAGWSGGVIEMDRAIRINAAEWRDGDKLARDRIATAIGDSLARAYRATREAATWNEASGKLKLTFRRPSAAYPALGLVEKLDVNALVAPEKPDANDKFIVWTSGPTITTIDEASGPKLTFGDPFAGDEEGETRSDSTVVDVLARDFKGQRWDADATAWK